MWDIAWATIKGRKGGFVGVFVAVLCASALVTALGVLFETGLNGGVPPQRYAAATVVVGGRQVLPVTEDTDVYFSERVPVPASAVDRIAALPEVHSAVGDVSVAVDVVVDGRLVGAAQDRRVAGHGWSSAALAPFTMRDGVPPAGRAEVVLDADLAERAAVRLGDGIDVIAGSVTTRHVVVGIVNSPQGNPVLRQSTLFFTDERARELSGKPDQVDAIGVLGRPGVDPGTLAQRISTTPAGDDVVTYTGESRGDVEFLDIRQARAELVELSLSLAGTAIVIAMLVVGSTLALSIRQRRREFALLRAVAAGPRQIKRMVGAEILLLSSVAAVLGAGPGIAVSYLLRDAFTAGGLLPPDLELVVGPFPAAVAVVLCVGAAWIAGQLAARRPARMNPVEALGEAAVEDAALPKGRVLAGWSAAILGLAASAMPLAFPGEAAVAGGAGSAVLLIVAAALLGPRLASVMVRALAGPLRWAARITGPLAVANTRANSRRTAAAVTPLALAVTIASVQIFTQTTVAAAAAEQTKRGVVADFVVSGTASGLAPEVVDAIGGIDGVTAVNRIARTEVFVLHTEAGDPVVTGYAGQGIDTDQLDRTLDLVPQDSDLTGLRGDTVALSRQAAESIGTGVGSVIDMRLGDGTRVAPTVAAIYGRGAGFGDITLPYDQVVRHTDTRSADSILVRAADGVDRQALGHALRALGTNYPGLVVVDRAGLAAVDQPDRQAQAWIDLVVLVVLLGYIAIAVVNTLVMTTTERVGEFARMRLAGAGRRQVRRMMRTEAVIVVCAATVIGTLAAIPPLAGISIGLTESPLPAVSPVVYAGIVGGIAVIGLLAVGVPTRAGLRYRPIDAIGTRE